MGRKLLLLLSVDANCCYLEVAMMLFRLLMVTGTYFWSVDLQWMAAVVCNGISASHPLMHHRSKCRHTVNAHLCGNSEIQIYSTYKFIILLEHKPLSKASIAHTRKKSSYISRSVCGWWKKSNSRQTIIETETRTGTEMSTELAAVAAAAITTPILSQKSMRKSGARFINPKVLSHIDDIAFRFPTWMYFLCRGVKSMRCLSNTLQNKQAKQSKPNPTKIHIICNIFF